MRNNHSPSVTMEPKLALDYRSVSIVVLNIVCSYRSSSSGTCGNLDNILSYPENCFSIIFLFDGSVFSYSNGSLRKAKYPLPLPVSERDGKEGIHKPYTSRSYHSYNTVQLHCNLMLQIIRHLAALKKFVMLAKLGFFLLRDSSWKTLFT